MGCWSKWNMLQFSPMKYLLSIMIKSCSSLMKWQNSYSFLKRQFLPCFQFTIIRSTSKTFHKIFSPWDKEPYMHLSFFRILFITGYNINIIIQRCCQSPLLIQSVRNINNFLSFKSFWSNIIINTPTRSWSLLHIICIHSIKSGFLIII